MLVVAKMQEPVVDLLQFIAFHLVSQLPQVDSYAVGTHSQFQHPRCDRNHTVVVVVFWDDGLRGCRTDIRNPCACPSSVRTIRSKVGAGTTIQANAQ